MHWRPRVWIPTWLSGRVGIVLTALLTLFAADQLWYKPAAREEEHRREQFRQHCHDELAAILAEGGSAAAEQMDGRLTGCRFGTPLG